MIILSNNQLIIFFQRYTHLPSTCFTICASDLKLEIMRDFFLLVIVIEIKQSAVKDHPFTDQEPLENFSCIRSCMRHLRPW
jgi:hypothetical protein